MEHSAAHYPAFLRFSPALPRQQFVREGWQVLECGSSLPHSPAADSSAARRVAASKSGDDSPQSKFNKSEFGPGRHDEIRIPARAVDIGMYRRIGPNCDASSSLGRHRGQISRASSTTIDAGDRGRQPENLHEIRPSPGLLQSRAQAPALLLGFRSLSRLQGSREA